VARQAAKSPAVSLTISRP